MERQREREKKKNKNIKERIFNEVVKKKIGEKLYC